jgi:TRAP-type mannitol/chloroaromatic compound transport system permease small subunit
VYLAFLLEICFHGQMRKQKHHVSTELIYVPLLDHEAALLDVYGPLLFLLLCFLCE